MNVAEIMANEPENWYAEMMAVRRGRTGVWCGYVAVGPAHPLYGKGFHDVVEAPADVLTREISLETTSVLSLLASGSQVSVEEGRAPLDLCIDVHGGISWDGPSAGYEGAEPDGNWWFGFDCGHAGDYVPKYDMGDTYRTFEYAQAQTIELAKQLARFDRATAQVGP